MHEHFWKLHALVPDAFRGHRFSIKSLLQLSLSYIDRDGGYRGGHL